jgi:WD40 repeat protein
LSTISNGTGLSYNANGTVLALGTWFGVSLLNPDTGAVEKVLLSGNTPGSVTFSPSGTMLGAAADGLGNQSELFDVGSGKEIQLGGSNPNSVEYGYGFNNSSLAFTPDGRFVIAGPGSGGATAVFDTATGKLVRTLNTGPPSLNGFPSFVATSPNASVPLLAVAFNTDSSNSSIEIWNTRTWKEEFLLTTTSDVQYSAVAFSPDGNRLAVAETNGSAAIWSIPTRREIVPLLGQTAAINSIAFSPEGTEVATASADGTVRVWRAGGPELDDLYLAGSIKSVGLSTDGVVVASLEGQQIEVSAWKMSALKVSPLSHFLIPGSSSYDVVSVSPDGRYVADFANRSPPCPVGQLCPSGLVRVYSVKTGQLLHTKSSDGVYPVAGAEAMAWSHDDHAIAVASSALEVVSLKTGLAVALSVQGAEQCGVDGAPAFSSNDSLVAWATVCGDVAVFRLSGESLGEPVGTPVSSFQVQGAPSGVAFNPAGTQLAVSNSSGAVVVFDPLTHRQEFALPTASSGVTSVAYSPDGRYLVTTLLDESAQIWGADGPLHGDLQRVDQNAAPLLIAPAFDAGGGDFATGDSAGTVKIWAECPACGDPGLLMKIAKGRVVAQLTPLEQGAKQ